ncbi:MAG: SBBP repeat-containing protein [Bryobacteraceae bacterium]
MRLVFAGIACLCAGISQAEAAAIGVTSKPILGARINAAAVDKSGNVYLTGGTSFGGGAPVNRFPATPGAFQSQVRSCKSSSIAAPCVDAVVVKLSPSGNIIYASFLGGSDDEEGTAIAVDDSGNAYVTGYTYSSDFPVTANAIQKTYAGPSSGFVAPTSFARPPGGDVFVTTLNPSGSALVYSTFLGGAGDDIPSSIVLDAAANIFVAGSTSSTGFPVTANAYAEKPLNSKPQSGLTLPSGFLTKLSSSGSASIYSTYFDAPVFGLALDTDADAYITGAARAKFTTTLGTYQEQLRGDTNAFAAKLSSDGKRLLYSTLLGGSKADFGLSIAVDSAGSAWISGYTTSNDFPLTLPPDLDQGGAFLARLDPTGSILVVSELISGTTQPYTGQDRAYTVMLDSLENPTVFGSTSDPMFPTTGTALERSSCSSSPYFITKWSQSGALTYASFSREGRPLTSDSAGNVFASSQGSYFGDPGTVVTKFDFALRSNNGAVGCIRNAASFGSIGISPGEVVSIFGDRLGPELGIAAELDSRGNIPTDLACVRVLFNGIPSPLLYVQANQINAVVPFELMPGTSVDAVVQTAGVNTPFSTFAVSSEPGIFRLYPITSNPGQGAILNEDGSVNSTGNPAKTGSVISIFATGTGIMEPIPEDGSVLQDGAHLAKLPVEVIFPGPTSGVVIYAGGAPGLVAGVTQINVRVPETLPDFGKRPRITRTLRSPLNL